MKRASKRAEKLFAEHYEQGDYVMWQSPPLVRDSFVISNGPTRFARVTMIVAGAAMVRFLECADKSVRQIVTGQPCEPAQVTSDWRAA
jgi:hypothetical protein